MGAKLSKKKKGYCLGAGKDGESTETTEVEQKETETQMGQKDAAEPNGENALTDQTPNGGASEEQKSNAGKNSMEVSSDKTTKDDLNKDQKSESKPSAEQTKVEESNQEQDKPEHAKSSNISQTVPEAEKEVKSQPEEQKTDHNKDKESIVKDEPTQECKSITEQESSGSKQSNKSVTEPLAPVPDQKEEAAKPAPDPETKVTVEKMEKEQTSLPTTEPLSEQVTKEATPVTDDVKEPEKVNEKTEQVVLETPTVAPLLQEPDSAPEVEVAESEPASNVVEPETEVSSLSETQPITELAKPEPDLAPEPVTESKVSEEPMAPVPEVETVEPVTNPELVPCPEPEKLSETKQEVDSIHEQLPSNEVPDSTAHVEDNEKNDETLGNDDLDTKLVETQAATTESEATEQPSAEKVPNQDAPIAENNPSEQATEETQESKVQDTVSTEQEVDKETQDEVKEDKPPTDHGSLQKDCKDTEEAALDTSKNVNDQVAPEDTVVDATHDNNSEIENHEIPAEELSHEPSAPLIVEKHGVSNGLPLKEDVKEHLENGCDTNLHELNGQSEGLEIELCNE
ncbi:fibrous sheath CABYR-binding protein-like [Hyla sarda]|uniref:fibrous sheath CABYR-binding protein-like n=1 Tax=Hyla sarda TaxID=327740 RepID=UPI0024C2391B|nr:fibrous sheath CABYR-binding protein-like [Hyla sarda]XP_056382068.1 fibrous sheath CABYR-binding protein-like [Hyla sarda]XP_056382069.1 fibrous sheath CABYR-binding protein-like [Hyla sarda]XP_056382070.1 fibrous sheath CABYR-binding protein-like [Hyla sarda]XP_056382072.1 fibrous sheath CABYR-binding protein-like [Hyla sarda]